MSAFAGAAFVHVLPWTGGAVVAILAVTFLIGRAVGRYNVVDTAWGLLFVGVSLATQIISHGHGDALRRWLLLVMVGLWGARIAVHVGRRSAGKGEDPRYAALLERGHTNPDLNALGKVFIPQAVLAFIISAPLQVGPFESGGVGLLGGLGVLLWAVGLFFETVGDAQMERYKAWKKTQPPERVKASVMDRGLWHVTRHPNYFGDACVWWGIFLVTAERWPGLLTVPAPMIMTYLLAFGSGKKNLERSMVKRPGYRQYMQRTSGFFPLPPKSRPAGPDAGRPGAGDVSIRKH